MRTAVETEAINLHPIVKISDQELYFTTIKHMQHKLSTESEDFNSTKKKKNADPGIENLLDQRAP